MALELWGDGAYIDRVSLDVSGRFALALRDCGESTAAMRLFDTHTLTAAGPEIRLTDWVSGHGCLAETSTDLIAVDIARDRISLWDPRRGVLLAEIAAQLPFTPVMAAATLIAEGRTVLVAHGETGVHECRWQAYDLHTGRQLPWGDSHYAYYLNEARIRSVGDLLVVTAQDRHVNDHGDEDETCVARVYQLPDGAQCGSVELAGGDAFTTAEVAGTHFLAATGHPAAVYALPSLRVTRELTGAKGQITLGSLGGRPVAVAETGSRSELGLWHLDRPGERAVVLTVPLRDWPDTVTDLVLSASGSLLVGTASSGLWAATGKELV